MSDIEALLHDAGQRWRASQPAAPTVDATLFGAPGRTMRSQMVAVAATAVAAVVVVALVSLQFGGTGVTGGGPAFESQGASDTAASPSEATSPPPECDVTKPVPAFVPPEGELREPPPGSQWFGRAALYTALDPAGEIWRGLPENPDGFTQKTVWWSVDWRPDEEPEPEIYVTGERLDAPGTFEFGPGTNASAPDIATAMMVGIDVAALGCWRITARYRDAILYYDVLVTAD